MAGSDGYINLNVGGIYYTTSLLTLNACPDSMLGKMFGDGGVPPKPDKNGHFFIDRDGKMFRFILNFMRDKRLCVPSSFEEYDQLLAEADFFQLYDLKEEVLSKMNPHPASVIAGEPLQKEVVVLRKDMYFFTCSSSRMGEWSDFQQKCVCAVEAKRETWMKLKSLASASLATLPVHHMRNDSKVSTCPGMESKIYPNESCPLVITSMIQDGFKLENTVTIDGSEYMIFTLMYSK